MINATVDTGVLSRKLITLSKRDLPRAVGAALKRAGTSTRAVTQRTMREQVNLKAAVVRAGISLERVNDHTQALALGAPEERLGLELVVRGGPVPLRDYQARMTRRGATFKVKRGGKRRVYERKGKRGFIIGTGRGRSFKKSARYGGHVFVRLDDDAIAKRFGPGLTHVFRHERVQAAMRTTFQDVFRKRLAHELTRRIKRLEARGGRG